MNALKVKPGYRTSEFWLTVVSFIFSGLYLIGLLDDHSQKEDLIHETSRGVEAVILILGQLTVLFRYIKGRTEIKKTWWNIVENENKTNNEESNTIKLTEKKNNVKSRKSTPKKQTTRTNKKQPRKSK